MKDVTNQQLLETTLSSIALVVLLVSMYVIAYLSPEIIESFKQWQS